MTSAFDDPHLKIKCLTVITVNGVKQFKVGSRVGEKPVLLERIVLQQMKLGDDPVYYYCGFNMERTQPMLFAISINCPHEIEYE